jgi:hypothetical protein
MRTGVNGVSNGGGEKYAGWVEHDKFLHFVSGTEKETEVDV